MDQNDYSVHEPDLDIPELFLGDPQPENLFFKDENLDNLPVLQLLSWTVENQRWVDMYMKQGLEYTVMDDVIRNAGAPCLTWKTVIGFISRSSGIQEHVQSYHHCPVHMCFSEELGSSEITH